MLVGSVGKAFAIVLGRPGFESPHHHFQPATKFIFYFIYVLKEHVLASQGGSAAAGAIEGGVEHPGIS